ncbi:MAG TPA: hypothetical protein VF256_10235 [Streptosporangiaceae bacterium]
MAQWAPTLPVAPPGAARARGGPPALHPRRARPAEAEALLAPLRAVATPLHDDVRERPVTDVDAVHRHSRHPTPVDEGGVVLRELPAEAVDALLAAAGPDVPSPLDLVELRAMGGALERPAAVRNVVAGRGAAWSVWVRGPLAPGGPGVSGVPRGSGDRDVPDEIRGAGRRDAGDWRAGALVPGRGAAELRGRGTARGTLVARRPSAAAVQQAVDPDGMFARTPLP